MEPPKGGASLKKEIEIPLKGMVIGVPCWTPIWVAFEVLPADALSSAAEARGVLAGCQKCTSPTGVLPKVDGYGSKLNHKGTAGFSLCYHLLGLHFVYICLTRSHICRYDVTLELPASQAIGKASNATGSPSALARGPSTRAEITFLRALFAPTLWTVPLAK